MKNFTLISALALITLINPLAAQEQVKTLKWIGYKASEQEPEETRSNAWDTQTANWFQVGSFLPLPYAWSDGANALINDEGAEITTNIKVDGAVTMASLEVNSSADYTISGSGSLEGEGDFIKEGTGSVTFEASNKLKGVTYLKEGSIVMSKVSSDAVSDSLVLMGGTLNIGTDGKNNGVISFPIHIPEGVAGNISTSRYNYMESHISGKGDLHIYTAGERVYLGSKNAGAKMDGFEGNVYIHKLDKGLGSGQYGLILRGDGTYLPEADEDGNHGIVTNYFANTKVHLGSGTHLMSESKEFCYQIGELTCEDETATWWGYYWLCKI